MLIISMKPNAMNKDRIEADLELFRDLINKSNDAIFVNEQARGHPFTVKQRSIGEWVHLDRLISDSGAM